MKVSIIIPCKEVDSFVEECIEHCRKLDYNDYEIIVLPDSGAYEMEGVKIISTGPLTPGGKRNIGIENSSGKILAFIDSDAYPRRDWLKNAVRYFDDPRIAAVGGPGITPKEDGWMQKASGGVLSSFMVGSLSRRYRGGKAYESDDIHSCNFVARRDVLEKVRWDEKYWPGEDTLICLDVKKLGMKMLESPDVVVYHHRRPLFRPHMRQIFRFGVHRGFFARKFPETSFRLSYFLPSLFLLGLVSGVSLSLFSSFVQSIFISVIFLYLLLVFASSLKKDVRLIPLVSLGIVLTHIMYGVGFLRGLTMGSMER